MLLLNPLPWKVIFHAIYPELSVALQEVALIDAEKISILYLYLSKDITSEKEELLFWIYRNKYSIL
jgi:hypothetical protein